VRIGHVEIGGGRFAVMAGPCAVESYEQLSAAARAVKAAGAQVLRAGAYKPRTSPYSFQGLQREGLEILRTVAQEVDILTVSEVIDPRDVEMMGDYVDILQINRTRAVSVESTVG
jgi:3-deoxy-7-phosphoheptulonate synthase